MSTTSEEEVCLVTDEQMNGRCTRKVMELIVTVPHKELTIIGHLSFKRNLHKANLSILFFRSLLKASFL